MSTVQEIEAALSRLPPEDLRAVECWIAELKKGQEAETAYAQEEYGATPAELERFDRRMKEEIEADRHAGRLREFSGDLERDLED